MEANISHNDNKSVTNSIMGFNVLVPMNTMYEVDTHRVDGMCVHTSRDMCN
jgi:hypothetical protein